MKKLFYLFAAALMMAGCGKDLEPAVTYPVTGKAGTLDWKLTDEGILTVNGKGVMPDYDATRAARTTPWSGYTGEIKVVVIGSGVTSVGDNAFVGCTVLVTVTLPDGIEVIGKGAFAGCTALVEIEIPDGIEIGNGAFAGCDNLPYDPADAAHWGETGTLDWVLFKDGLLFIDGVGEMPDYNDDPTPWYEHHDDVKTVKIEEGITNIGDHAFDSCSSLTHIDIPDSVTSVGEWAFHECASLARVEIPNSVMDIGRAAFYNSNLEGGISLPDGLTSIEYGVFAYSRLATIFIPVGVTSIGDFAFDSCAIEAVNIPDGVTSIGLRTFSRCHIKGITIPDNVTSIADGAFWQCRNMTGASIGSGVTSIGNSAFYECNSLTNVTIMATTPPTLGENNFNHGSAYDTLYVPAGCVETYKAATAWNEAFTYTQLGRTNIVEQQ